MEQSHDLGLGRRSHDAYRRSLIEVSPRAMAARLRIEESPYALAALSGVMVVLVGLAAVMRVDAAAAPTLLVAVVAAAIGLAASLLLRDSLAFVGTIVAIGIITIFADAIVQTTPTVVWLFALVVPAIGLASGPRLGGLAGLLAAPALHWIETGVPIELADPQTPYGILILVALGMTPGQLLLIARRRRAQLDVQLARTEVLVDETEQARAAEAAARHQAVFMLARAAEARDGTTGLHIEHVRDLAAELAGAAGVPEAEIDQIGWSAMLHDVGKIRVPDRVLLKPGQLDAEEWALIRQHPLWGEELLMGDEGFALARQIARWHHEDWDGSGYPDGLRGEAIPFAARIVRVVDVFDALRSARPYKEAWTVERALDELAAMRGKGLDPELADLFIDLRRAGS